MPLVCPKCGAYALNNTERSPNATTCSACGQSTSANIFPLFIVTGASGSGKSTVVSELRCSHDKSGSYRSVSSSTLTTTMNRVATGDARTNTTIPGCSSPTVLPREGDTQSSVAHSCPGTLTHARPVASSAPSTSSTCIAATKCGSSACVPARPGVSHRTMRLSRSTGGLPAGCSIMPRLRTTRRCP